MPIRNPCYNTQLNTGSYFLYSLITSFNVPEFLPHTHGFSRKNDV